MAKLYGIGASVVIVGALFKINHYWGADIMLIVGLGTESIIFFFSAFEPPHVEPDWSLVYPQLAGIYHQDENSEPMGAFKQGDSVTNELDKMLEKAKIGPELIESLGTGLKNLTETTSQLNNVSNAAVANDTFVTTVKSATESASILGDSYKKTAKSLETELAAKEEHVNSIQSVNRNAAALSSAYAMASESIKEEINFSKDFNTSMKSITTSANTFVQKYTESADILTKTAEALNNSTIEGTHFNKQLQKVSHNLSALNALYELHLQNSDEQMQATTKVNESLGKLAGQLNESLSKTTQFKDEVEALNKNIAALNKVYGNMLSAMNVTMK
ncbi:MAG: gliding motility protein GldL [Syntrophothermus sp.]